jgi:DNA-binding response OmpR family regulator
MSNSTISIFRNKILFEILSEMKLFSKYTVKYYDNEDSCVAEAEKKNELVVFFASEITSALSNEIKKKNFPLMLVGKKSDLKNKLFSTVNSQITIPFSIFDFKKKVIETIAKSKFKKNSLINLNDYIIDKNERKIKKNNIELQLSEKEISFLILFSDSKNPISRNLVLKTVWNYSPESETHTVETHIHRLRKKILEKFGDNNFIKNNHEGYYI